MKKVKNFNQVHFSFEPVLIIMQRIHGNERIVCLERITESLVSSSCIPQFRLAWYHHWCFVSLSHTLFIYTYTCTYIDHLNYEKYPSKQLVMDHLVLGVPMVHFSTESLCVLQFNLCFTALPLLISWYFGRIQSPGDKVSKQQEGRSFELIQPKHISTANCPSIYYFLANQESEEA